MSASQDSILAELAVVARERERRAADPALAAQVSALKHYQQRRFAHSHAALLADPRFGDAARFFLDDLYGPQDFSTRDAQFARIVPALVRLFPQEIVETVHALAALHALSEVLDTAMATALGSDAPARASYTRAWQAVGRSQDRGRQLAMVLDLGRQLQHYTGRRLLRQSLRLMRGPARAAGLGELQTFLERGFDTFGAMGPHAATFLERVQARESALMARLFEPDAVAVAARSEGPGVTDAIGQLP